MTALCRNVGDVGWLSIILEVSWISLIMRHPEGWIVVYVVLTRKAHSTEVTNYHCAF